MKPVAYPFSAIVGQPEMKLGLGIPFIGSKPKPSRSLGVVLWDAVAIRVGEPEIVLSDGQTLIRCLAQPPGRLGIIPLYAPTSGIQLPEIKPGEGITLIGEAAQYLMRDGVVAFAYGSSSIVERGCGCACSKEQHNQNGAEDQFERAHHLGPHWCFGGYGQPITFYLSCIGRRCPYPCRKEQSVRGAALGK